VHKHLAIDLAELMPSQLPLFDHIHFSPSCKSTSYLNQAAHGRHQHPDALADSEQGQTFDQLMQRIIAIIFDQTERRKKEGLPPFSFSIEQPRGHATKHPDRCRLGWARPRRDLRCASHRHKDFLRLEDPVKSGGHGAILVELHMCSFGAAERAPPSVARSQLPPPVLPPAGAFFEGRPIKKPTLMWINMPVVAAAYQARVGGRGALLP